MTDCITSNLYTNCVGSVLLIFLQFSMLCWLFCFRPVLCVHCCRCLWIVHSGEPLRVSLTFIIFVYIMLFDHLCDYIFILCSQVVYSTEGFLERNRDNLSSDLVGCMLNSNNEFIKDLFTASMSPTGTISEWVMIFIIYHTFLLIWCQSNYMRLKTTWRLVTK